jgi:rhamnose transport system permease protein
VTLTRRNQPAAFIPLVLGLLALIGFCLLPFVHQPELGASTVRQVTESRASNEFGLETNGLQLIPFAALVAVLAGFLPLINRQLSRAGAALCALAGVLVLQYFTVFFLSYSRAAASYLSAMGIGFWSLLGIGILMIAQMAFPRPVTDTGFELRELLANQESAIVIALVLLLLIIGITNPRFLAERNLLDILQGNAYIAVAAIGMSMVIITGNIDISVGSLIGLLAVISGRLVVAGTPIIVAWIVPLVIGALVGALIGFLVAYLRVPSIVVTLGMLSIIKGGLIIWTSGQRVTGMPDGFYLAQMRVFGISTPIIFMLVLTLLAALWMRYSSLGRAFYALGGNAEAARLSGFSQTRLTMQVFIINGIFVGIAAVLYATQLRVIQTTPPPALELFIITAAVVGGVSILGGKGTVIGAMLAAILLNTIRSGMIFINVSPFWIQAVQGLLILITVLIDLIRRRRQMI